MFDWTGITENIRTTAAAQLTFTPLYQQPLLVVAGDDAQTFLQGQCTCDFRRLTLGDFLLGAHCNHQGRMNSTFVAAALPAEIGVTRIGLRVHRSIEDSAMAALKKYAVFSKVEIHVSGDIGAAVIDDHSANGHAIDKLLTSLGIDQLDKGKVANIDELTLLRRQAHQLELWGAKHALSSLIQNGDIAISLADETQWELNQIEQGLAQVRAQTVDMLIPQEINLPQVGGVSFDKGCYTGQEIVARMHYRGKLKKHMYRASLTTQYTPFIGQNIIDVDSSKTVGTIINCVPQSDNTYQLLAITKDDAQSTSCTIAQAQETAKSEGQTDLIRWLTLPYTIIENPAQS